jgi:carbonic anhydrase/acetyltransferase-like protein (isoleucine patch superfamily)
LSPIFKPFFCNSLTLSFGFFIIPSSIIDPNYSFLISIGNKCVINRGVKILAHDATAHPFLDGHGRLGRVKIEDNCIIGTDVIILPGVKIGPNVLIASGSMVNKDIPSNSCVAGVPARFYFTFENFIKMNKEKMEHSYIIDGERIRKTGFTEEDKKKILEESEKGDVYISGCRGMDSARYNY